MNKSIYKFNTEEYEKPNDTFTHKPTKTRFKKKIGKLEALLCFSIAFVLILQKVGFI